MPTNYEKSIEAIKAKHGGVLPSDLYLRTNAELSKLVFDLTGKQPSGTASKTSLVTRIEKHEAKIAAAGAKRKAADDSGKENGAAPKAARTSSSSSASPPWSS